MIESRWKESEDRLDEATYNTRVQQVSVKWGAKRLVRLSTIASNLKYR